MELSAAASGNQGNEDADVIKDTGSFAFDTQSKIEKDPQDEVAPGMKDPQDGSVPEAGTSPGDEVSELPMTGVQERADGDTEECGLIASQDTMNHSIGELEQTSVGDQGKVDGSLDECGLEASCDEAGRDVGAQHPPTASTQEKIDGDGPDPEEEARKLESPPDAVTDVVPPSPPRKKTGFYGTMKRSIKKIVHSITPFKKNNKAAKGNKCDGHATSKSVPECMDKGTNNGAAALDEESCGSVEAQKAESSPKLDPEAAVEASLDAEDMNTANVEHEGPNTEVHDDTASLRATNSSFSKRMSLLSASKVMHPPSSPAPSISGLSNSNMQKCDSLVPDTPVSIVNVSNSASEGDRPEKTGNGAKTTKTGNGAKTKSPTGPRADQKYRGCNAQSFSKFIRFNRFSVFLK